MALSCVRGSSGWILRKKFLFRKTGEVSEQAAHEGGGVPVLGGEDVVLTKKI